MNLQSVKDQAEKFDVISFDFFDTLFFRKVEEPESVFDVVGNKFGISDFRALRKKAQQLAFVEMLESKRFEITLDDIYNNFNELSLELKPIVKSYEFNLEVNVVYPNKDMVDVFLHCLNLGKCVVITSDMYLKSDYFVDVLAKYNLPQVPLFISADRNATKRDFGSIYDHIASDLNCLPSKILHIGDNYLADVEKANAKGVTAYHYEYSTTEQRKNLSLSESVVRGLTARRAHSWPENSGEKLAWEYGGAIIAGYHQWLKKAAIRDEIDVLIYLARDGYMIKAFSDRDQKNRSSNLQEVYLKGSRTSFMLSSITDDNFEENIPWFLSGSHELSTNELFERIGIASPSQKMLDALGFYEDKSIKEISPDSINNLFFAMKRDILNVCRENRRGLHQLLTDLHLPENANIALVDVGWRGTTQDAFENAIRPFFNYNVYGYYFCLINSNGNKKAMIDSASFDKDLINKIYNNRVVFELFFSAPHETVVGHVLRDNKVEFVEVFREKSSQEFFAPLEREMISFFDALNDFTSKIEYMPDEYSLVKPFIDYAINGEWKDDFYLSSMLNFDAWSTTKNITLSPGQYT